MRDKFPLEQVLVKDSIYQSNKLRIRLIKEGYFEHKCYTCNLAIWNELPIPLELEHKNGINSDHRLENLTLICPNCHAQTITYRGKNRGRGRNKHHYAKE
jgi:Zn finger protein HypA/HybF involved in hydrogenase expression